MLNEFKEAAGRMPLTADARPVQAIQIWGYSLGNILQLVIDKARELGIEYREEIEAAARGAVDALAALDLPYIPDYIEGTIDEATKQLGYKAIESVLDALLA